MTSPNPRVAPAALPITHKVPTHLSLRFRQVCLSLQDEAIAEFGLRPLHCGVLMELRHHAEGIDQTRLAATLGRDQTTVSQNVDELATLGVVERRVPPDDRRARIVLLTDAGRALQQRLAPTLAALQARILAPLGPQDAETLLTLLVRLVEAHEAHARPGAARRRPRPRQPSANAAGDPSWSNAADPSRDEPSLA